MGWKCSLDGEKTSAYKILIEELLTGCTEDANEIGVLH
jgi:hypothetical protein